MGPALAVGERSLTFIVASGKLGNSTFLHGPSLLFVWPSALVANAALKIKAAVSASERSAGAETGLMGPLELKSLVQIWSLNGSDSWAGPESRRPG